MINEIKFYLKAKSENDLVSAMYVNNISHKTEFKYDTPIKLDSGWIVWFTCNIEKYETTQKNIKAKHGR